MASDPKKPRNPSNTAPISDVVRILRGSDLAPIPDSDRPAAGKAPMAPGADKQSTRDIFFPNLAANKKNDPSATEPDLRRPITNMLPAGPDSQSGERLKFNRKDERQPCSFPGMMRVVVPERSFEPLTIVVRVLNFSAGGALVEVHQQQKGVDVLQSLASRFVEMKVAHPEVPLLRGIIAWTDLEMPSPKLGIRFHTQMPQLMGLFDPQGTGGAVDGPRSLPMPTLEPFPPLCDEPTVTIRGTAEEANEVVITNETGVEVRAPVRGGTFAIVVPLGKDNMFMLRSVAGERKSRRLPIEITYISPEDRNRVGFDAATSRDREGMHLLNVEFRGPEERAQQLLSFMAKVLSHAEYVAVSMKLRSSDPYDEELYAELLRQGKVLQESDRGRADLMKMLDFD